MVQTPTFVSDLPPFFNLEGGATNGGDADSFSIVDAASLDEASALTVEMWVSLDSVTSTPMMLFSKRSSASDGLVGFVTDAGFTFRIGTGAGAEITWSTSPRLQTWQHLVVTVDATGSHIYNNGGLVASSAYAGDFAALNTGAPLLLGDVNGGTGVHGFDGRISEFRLYQGSLTAPEAGGSFGAARARYGIVEDGLAAATAALSPTQLQMDFPDISSGAYYYRIPGTSDVVQLYTDFDGDGGAWVVVSKWGARAKSTDAIFNASARGAENLASADFPAFDEYSRLSREAMNAIWEQSRHIARIHFRNDEATATSGVYFQQKLTNAASFDFWAGHYNPLPWADGQGNGTFTSGGGSTYSVCFAQNLTVPDLAGYVGSSQAYDPETNAIIGGTGRNQPMGYWDQATVSASGYGNLVIGRHMGFFGDITSGNQWLFTANPADSRYATAESRRTIVLLRW